MVDRELNDSDKLLRDRGRSGLKARRVQGANHPQELIEHLRPDGWTPVETRISVSDVPAVVHTLGGAKLYGRDKLVPIRELIQNARDAVEARRRLETARSPDWGSISVELSERGEPPSVWLSVEDSGVGMSRATLTGVLLDFGKSLWRSTKIQEEFPGLAGAGMKSVGRFGIGFFSVFMLGHEVRVITRRFDRGAQESLMLEFANGLGSRPILSQAKEFVPLDGGTRVEVRLTRDPRFKGGLNFSSEEERWFESRGKTLASIVASLAPALDVSIKTRAFGKPEQAIRAGDWLTISADELADRLSSNNKLRGNLAEIRTKRGPIYGRAALCPRRYFDSGGVVTVGGLRATSANWAFGILKGKVQTAARTDATLLAPGNVLRSWATRQALLIAASDLKPEEKVDCAKTVLSLGGDPGTLPLARIHGEWLNRAQIRGKFLSIDEVVVHVGDLEYEDFDYVPKLAWENYFEPAQDILLLPGNSLSPAKRLRTGVLALAREAWGGVEEEERDEHHVGKVSGDPILREVEVWRRPSPGTL